MQKGLAPTSSCFVHPVGQSYLSIIYLLQPCELLSAAAILVVLRIDEELETFERFQQAIAFHLSS
jgi:hypothetical protein